MTTTVVVALSSSSSSSSSSLSPPFMRTLMKVASIVIILKRETKQLEIVSEQHLTLESSQVKRVDDNNNTYYACKEECHILGCTSTLDVSSYD